MYLKKCSLAKIKIGEKRLFVKKNYFLVKKFLGETSFLVKKIFSVKFFGVNFFLDKKNCLDKKKILVENVFL